MPAHARPAHVMVALDISNSNPVVRSVDHASRLARDVEKLFPKLGKGAIVSMMTFGLYDVTQNRIVDIPVSTRARPKKVKRSILGQIVTIPRLVEDGKLTPHSKTNIIGALEDIARSVNCRSHDVTIILLTDGRENSSYGASPPKKIPRHFSPCGSLTMLGVSGSSPEETAKLIDGWKKWALKAGYAKFSAKR